MLEQSLSRKERQSFSEGPQPEEHPNFSHLTATEAMPGHCPPHAYRFGPGRVGPRYASYEFLYLGSQDPSPHPPFFLIAASLVQCTSSMPFSVQLQLTSSSPCYDAFAPLKSLACFWHWATSWRGD